jgi:hypothetical protein
MVNANSLFMSMYLTIMFLGTGKIMRIVEALENRGFRVQLSKEEADLYERLVAIIKQVSFFCPHIVFVFGWLWILCSCIFCIQIKGTVAICPREPIIFFLPHVF